MTIVVLVVLALLWVAVLTPSLLRTRARHRSDQSIGSFRRQLRVIQRTGPPVIAPANRRLGGATVEGPDPIAATSTEGEILSLGSPHRGRDAHGWRGWLVHGTHRPGSRAIPPQPRERRAQVVQRRRHVLLGLATSLVVTFLLGLIPPLRLVWLVSGLSMMALVAYVALLARLQGLATEREQKLAYLPRPPDTRHLLHRSAN